MTIDKTNMVAKVHALAGRDTALTITEPHFVFATPLLKPHEGQFESLVVGMGCFWGAERLFWQQPGVTNTAVGYSGGYTPNPTYQEVCGGQTGHAEVVVIHFDPQRINLSQLLTLFWESHDPTQGMRQGNDRGTQYRSVVLTQSEQQHQAVLDSLARYQVALSDSNDNRTITTEVTSLDAFYFAEAYHQQYLAKNPNGYCGLGGTGVCFPPQ